jgi:hypothetical protein
MPKPYPSVRCPTYGSLVTRLRQLTEAECYTRCYGTRGDSVMIVSREPRRARSILGVTGEHLRELFEIRLDTRDPDALAEPEAA